jgi:hypothetical protein
MNPIFISYTAKGRVYADRLRTALQDEGVETIDNDLAPGEDFANASRKTLRQAAAIVFLIGPDGQVSEQQRDEATAVFRAEWGKQRKTPLIPVVTGDTELPPFLRQVAAIKVEDIEQGWSGAAQKIKQSLSGAPSAAPLPTPSGESEQKARLLEIRRFADSLSPAPQSPGSKTDSKSSGSANGPQSSFRKKLAR